MSKLFCFYSIVFLSVIISFQTSRARSLFINEFMASNVSTVTDPDNKIYSDWIEIYNSGRNAVNLRGYFITDNLNDLKKYRIPDDLLIPGGGYVLIWADEAGKGNHTNFKLSASGESIAISDSSGILIDSLSFGEQLADISSGRFPDGAAELVKFFPSTPGSTNPEKSIYAKLPVPVFSLPGGFYDNTITLSLTDSVPGAVVHYTMDGSTPTLNSSSYTGLIKSDSTLVISARALKDGYQPSNTAVNTFFVKFQCDLPVFSISTDPANFFSDTSGIYVQGTRGITALCSTGPRNWNQDWERPVNLEFFEKDRSPAFNVKAGVKIYGGCSRLYDEKSLAFYFRNTYGKGKLHYRLFSDIPVTEYNNFILRSSGQDWWRTMFRDGMIHTLIKLGMNVDYQEYRPSILFINGQYWGIHNIREMLNDQYVSYRYGVDPDSVDLIELSKTVSASSGNVLAYNAFNTFFTNNSLANTENYEYVKSLVDTDEFIDYLIAEIYTANGDWPSNNTKLWRERSSSGKWRWMIYDTDFCFGGNSQGLYNTNTLNYATSDKQIISTDPPWATFIIRKMLENTEFRNEFIQRFAVHMGITFETAHVINVIDSMASNISSEIPRHIQRWPKSISLDAKTFTGNVQIMKDFAQKRQAEVRSHFYSKFNIPGAYGLTINRNNPAWGKVIAHTVEIKKNWTKLALFKNIPFKAKALAMPGYRFVRWEGASNSPLPEVVLADSVSPNLTAIFEPDAAASTDLVINEINYRSSSSFDTDDWIELYNPSEKDVDLAGWKVLDRNTADAFIFPTGTFITAQGYLVICRDSAKFNSLYLNKVHSAGDFKFGLDSDSDMIKILDKNGKLIDSVFYGSTGQWPSLSNSCWPTLSLINPGLDNTLAKSWKASLNHGTPGKLNDTYTTGVKAAMNLAPSEFRLFDAYPNPFNNSTVISFSIPERSQVSLKIYDLLGREVARLIDEEKSAGNYNVPLSLNSGSGIYIYVLQAGKYFKSKKMLLLK